MGGATTGELQSAGGRDAVDTFGLYVLATQDRDTAGGFGEELRRAVPGPGGDMMTCLEELIQEGERKGRQEDRQEGRLGTIENLLQAGVQWSVI